MIFYQIPHTDSPGDEIVPTILYFTAFFSLLAISDILLNQSLTAYILFLLPLCRVGVILVSVAAILIARRMYMVIRYAMLLVPFGFAAVAAFVPSLFTQKYLAGSFLLALGIFISGGLVFFLSTRN